MMENTFENKAALFAVYISAEPVCQTSNSDGILNWANYHLNIDHGFEKRWLLLKPLSSITNEHAEELTKISICRNPLSITIKREEDYFCNIEIVNTSDHSTWSLVLSDVDMYFKCGNSRSENDSSLILAVYDYLRSKGYALPYMGLSVEKQIKYGWIKLI